MYLMWGKRKENGLWLGKAKQYRLMIGGGDRLVYAHFHRFGMRLMKPSFMVA
ncbi:hypothetical protein GHK46_26360 [Sinorhizobium medicae]|uniref:hypothetical protein n=1 Tax=Sinorhizobium medicae TaxID=110321 RepID=UPI0012949EC9|nr:hypothetical protein [Sinorhizobium medicae]MQW00713.1 hypothetical protein [Sinorhizobium medicae]